MKRRHHKKSNVRHRDHKGSGARGFEGRAAFNVEFELEAGLTGACDAVSAATEERTTGELTSNTTAFEQMLPTRPVTVTVCAARQCLLSVGKGDATVSKRAGTKKSVE